MTSPGDVPPSLRELFTAQCHAIWDAARRQPEIEAVALFWMDDQGARQAFPLLKVAGRWEQFTEADLPQPYHPNEVLVPLCMGILSALKGPYREGFGGGTWPARVVTIWDPTDNTAAFDVVDGPLSTVEKPMPSQFMEEWVAEQNQTSSVPSNGERGSVSGRSDTGVGGRDDSAPAGWTGEFEQVSQDLLQSAYEHADFDERLDTITLTCTPNEDGVGASITYTLAGQSLDHVQIVGLVSEPGDPGQVLQEHTAAWSALLERIAEAGDEPPRRLTVSYSVRHSEMTADFAYE